MPQTSSFKINNIIQRDVVCYSHFAFNINTYKKQNILDFDNTCFIIEKTKYNYFGIDFCLKYLDLMKKLGFFIGKIKLNKSTDDLEIYINPKLVITRSRITATGMVIRYLWERTEGDDFVFIAKHFMNLVKYYEKYDIGLLFCFAHDLFGKDRKYYNSNHCFIYRGSRIKTFNTDQFNNILKNELLADFSVNATFSLTSSDDKNTFNDDAFENISIRDNYETKEDYDKALKLYNAVYNVIE